MGANKSVQMDETLLAELIGDRYKQMIQPFPYDDCRTLLASIQTGDSDFIPDLANYWATLDGHCSWGKRILDWPTDRAVSVLDWVNRPFTVQFPAYVRLWRSITRDSLPNLYGQIVEHDTQLADLGILLGIIIKSRSRPLPPLYAATRHG